MKPRIAVICAHNPNNAGMYSVDLAANRFFSNLYCKFDLFSRQPKHRKSWLGNIHDAYHPGCRHRSRIGEISYIPLLSSDQFKAYSHVIYWGDFQNNPIYGLNDFAKRDIRFGHSRSFTEAMSEWKKLYALLGGKPASKVFSIGNSFINELSSVSQRHPEVFKSLGEKFDVVLPRDPQSYANLIDELGVNASVKVGQGLDCAFLLPSKPSTSQRDQFCYHFGRSNFERLDRLVEKCAKAGGSDAIPLTQWLDLDRKRADALFQGMVSEMARSKFVLTDTYHVCVNAWRIGVPVLCIGNPSTMQEGTLGDFKKRELFRMMNGLCSYMEKEIDEPTESFFERVACYIETSGDGLFCDSRDILGEVKRSTVDFRQSLQNLILGDVS